MPKGRKKKEVKEVKAKKYELYSLTEGMAKLKGENIKSRAVANIAKNVENPSRDMQQIVVWKETFFIVRR